MQKMFLITLREFYSLLRSTDGCKTDTMKIINMVTRIIDLNQKIIKNDWNLLEKYIHNLMMFNLLNFLTHSKFLQFYYESDNGKEVIDNYVKCEIPVIEFNMFGLCILTYAELFKMTDIVNMNNIPNPLPSSYVI